MYRLLLVPLDRSSFAERALPLALSIARRATAYLDLVEVHALYVMEDSHAGWAPFEPDRDAECQRQEQLYFDATAKWVTSVARVSATTCVLSGSATLAATVADSLLERARNRQADLIVMATHGRGPLSRFGPGSVAEELIRRAPMPVLLVRPGPKAPGMIPEPVQENILIPLDGSTLAEQVLEPALDLARLMEARCTLVRVIAPRSAAGGRTSNGPPDRTAAEAYLERVGARVREHGLELHTRVVVARHAAEAILEEAKRGPADLIALATHGRGGIRRMLLGSVADKVLQGATLPVLVFRPPDK
jgi:nucleotide-binding universal stress UspA family protein